MILLSILFPIFAAFAHSPASAEKCGFNVEANDTSPKINKICFVKIESLKDSWQVRFHIDDGQIQNYFMKDPTYDQGVSVGSESVVLKSQLYTEKDSTVILGDIFFYYPISDFQGNYVDGVIPPGLRFRVLNMGAPGLKAP